MYDYKDWGIFTVKLLDKFIKKLKTDRNTFFTYILTLITAYIVVDRVIELLFMCFTCMSVSYIHIAYILMLLFSIEIQ